MTVTSFNLDEVKDLIEAELDSSILQIPSSPETKQHILNALWGHVFPDPSASSLFNDIPETYWSSYQRACTNALHDGGRHVTARCHRDITDTAVMLRAGMLRPEVKTELCAKLSLPHENEDEMLEGTIDLTASLMLMMDIGWHQDAFSGRTRLRWTDGTLHDFVARSFDPQSGLSVGNPDAGWVKLEKVFTARNLMKIAGLEIVWTDNLVDHIRLTDDESRVHLFHHAPYLQGQLNNTQTSPLPDGLVDETLRTIALLFPSADRDIKRWLSRETGLDPRLASCGRLTTDERQIDRFRFWRDRLVMLKQVFDESQPRNITQWWHDRRNGVQWYTFWVAILVLVLTVFFALVQSVEGAMQVYASFKALDDDPPT